MQMKRFVAPDMRRALEMVREQMGPDAVILSTKRQKDGVEILTSLSPEPETPIGQQQAREAIQTTEWPLMSDQAWRDEFSVKQAVAQHADSVLADGDYGSPSMPPQLEAASYMGTRRPNNMGDDVRGVASGKTRAELAAEIDAARDKMLAAKRLQKEEEERWPNTQAPSQAQLQARSQAEQQQADGRAEQQLDVMQREINGLRELLESQFEILAKASQPVFASLNKVQRQLVQRIQALGISEALAIGVAKRIDEEKTINEAWVEALVHLAHDIPSVNEDLVDKGGVFAFVGATGAGKTTTLAKLAARYVMRHGVGKVAVVTTDEARVGARDQLQAIGRIIKVPVIAVGRHKTLKQVLLELQDYELVLVDTAGLRNESMMTDHPVYQLSVLPKVSIFMVVASNCQASQAEKLIDGLPSVTTLAGCILTKLDETAGLGEMIDLFSRKQLLLAYTTHGQNIAQDLDVARSHKLITRAVALARPAEKSHINASRKGFSQQKVAAPIDQSAVGINVQHL